MFAKDFGGEAKLALDTVNFILQTRNQLELNLPAQKMPDLRITAKTRGIHYKRNLTKNELVEHMVRTICSFLESQANFERITVHTRKLTWNLKK